MYRSIRLDNPELMDLRDSEGRLFHGADQEWFPLSWQRRAGCGPTTASQLLLYNGRSRVELGLPLVKDKDEMVALMGEVWKYITPGIMGVHVVSHFTKGLHAYLSDHAIDLEVTSLALPRQREGRPSFDEVCSFITTRLTANQPVAFLNLNNGTQKKLDPWHWVTIVGLDQAVEDGPVSVIIYDAGISFSIDFSAWYETTSRASGFASLA